MVTKYWIGSHTTHRLRYHIVVLPKYRKRVLKGKIATRVKQLFFQACQVNKWWIDELNVQPDHVHMLIQTKPRESVAEVVQILKGGSSKVIRLEFSDLEEYLWGDSFWSDGYFAETVGIVNESVIKDYIKNQHDESISLDLS